ncbi:MAG: hypothetical protein PVJ02_03720, partial [Gemmatimonadota bacterium]
AAGQSLDLSGYALGVVTHSGSGALGSGGTALLGRGRIMPVVTWDAFTLDVAYEHLLQRTPPGGGFSITTPGGTGVRGGDWMGADWDIRSTSRSSWRHRFDRLSLAFDAGPLSVTVGRQAISWATTLFLTPGDPFAPFDPSDPFREYRGGVDAVRVRAFTGPFSEVEAVVRPADVPGGSTLTAVARAQMSRGGWAFGAWAGVVHDQGAATVFATGAAGATALRGSLSLRRDSVGDAVLRTAVGGDRRFTVADRDLFGVVELQYDGFGAASTEELLAAARSGPFGRGEMQTLGRWSAATQWSYQAHPLVSLDALALVNLEDGSALLAPGLSWLATASASLRLGLFYGAGGDGLSSDGGLQSEYGAVPTVGYAALSVFF